MTIVLEAESAFPHEKEKSVPEGSFFLSQVGLLPLKRTPQLKLELNMSNRVEECEL